MFGDVVRVQRRRVGLSQEELADRTGVAVRTIGKIENGRIVAPRPSTVRLLADAFGLADDERDEFCQAALSDAVPAPAGLRPAGAAVPAQLPVDPAGFVGRDDTLTHLTSLLDEQGAAAVVIAAITGSAGIGKTTLAVHWAHRIRHRFPDGQLYLNLRGFDPGGAVLQPAEAVRRLLEALEVPAEAIPHDLEARAALFRTRLAGRRMLLVLDNARDAEQVRPLLPGTAGPLVVVTSRYRLSGLVAGAGAHPVALDLLSPDEAAQLLTVRLGPERTAAEPEAVAELVRRCAQLPLALAVAAARAATHPAFPLHALAAELAERRDRLDVLASGEDPATDVRSVFSWSYRALSPEAARLFRLLGVHPGPDVSAAAAASLAGVPLRDVRRSLAELAAAHLIVEHAPGRYTFHDLLRAYAAEEAAPDERREALGRALDHLLLTAVTAAMRLNPGRDPIEPPAPADGVVPEPLLTQDRAMAWFRAEHAVLLAAADRAGQDGFDVHAWQLPWAMTYYLDVAGQWDDLADGQAGALAAARRLGDPGAEGTALRFSTLGLVRLGRFEEADRNLEEALALYREHDDLVGQAHTYLHRGFLRVHQDRFAESRQDTECALARFEQAGHRTGQALALNGIGWLLARLGELDEALACCRRALALQEERQDQQHQASTWDTLGFVRARRGETEESVRCYSQSVELLRRLGDRYGQAGSLSRLGDVQLAAGDADAAAESWETALELLRELDHPDAKPLQRKLFDLIKVESDE